MTMNELELGFAFSVRSAVIKLETVIWRKRMGNRAGAVIYKIIGELSAELVWVLKKGHWSLYGRMIEC